MSRIIAHKEIDRLAWSQLVKESRTGTWFQTPEAYDFFASQPDLFCPFAYTLINQQAQLRAICVGYVTKTTNAFIQFFSRRAIILGGPALADDCTEDEVNMLMEAVRKAINGQAIYIESRNFNEYSAWRGAFEKAGFAYQPHLNFHVDCTNRDKMLARLSDNRKRQLKKAESQGVQIVEAQSENEVREWYAILRELYQTKVKTPLFPETFFIRFYQKKVGVFMLVKQDGKVIGGSVLPMIEGKTMYEWFECGLNNTYKDLYPSVCVTFAGMQYAAQHDLLRYDMMGAGQPNIPYGVRDFKAEFGGTMVEHGRFLHIAKPILYFIGALVIKLIRKSK